MRYFISIIFLFLAACDARSPNLALGTLERDRVAHTATINEIVVALPVLQGSQVKKGTVLVQLDDTLQKAQVSKAEAEVAQAEANLDKLLNGARREEVAAASSRVEGAKASLVEDEAGYARARSLIKKKVISKANLDRALAARDASVASLNSFQEELLVLTNGTREEDLRVGKARLEAMNAVLVSEKKRLADLTIVATRDGVLDSLPWNLGERVTMGSPLAIVLAGKAPFARVYIPEPYRVKIKIGDTLPVHIDGIEQSIAGTLRYIATEPAFTPYYALNQEERSRLMYLAEVQLPDSESHLPNGVPAQVELP